MDETETEIWVLYILYTNWPNSFVYLDSSLAVFSSMDAKTACYISLSNDFDLPCSVCHVLCVIFLLSFVISLLLFWHVQKLQVKLSSNTNSQMMNTPKW